MIKSYLTWFIGTYGYTDFKEFLYSLFPSFKYGFQTLTIGISLIGALVSKTIGIGTASIVAMAIAVIVETVSGIYASKLRGEAFQSFKFSRCVIKVFVWYVLLYITNSFAVDMASKEGAFSVVSNIFFESIQSVILIYFGIEYVVSILENLAVIDGKPKDALTGVIRDYWKSITDRIKSKNDGK